MSVHPWKIRQPFRSAFTNVIAVTEGRDRIYVSKALDVVLQVLETDSLDALFSISSTCSKHILVRLDK